MGFIAWLRRLFGRVPQSVNLVPFYDAEAKRVIRIPAEELAPGCVRAQMQGVDEPVWVAAGQLQPGPYRHPAFRDDIREYIRRIEATLAEHNPMTAQEWEDGFRRDMNPEREIALWIHAANTYSSFAANEGIPERRRHLYQVVVACLTAPAEAVAKVLTPGPLSKEEVNQVVRRFYPGSGHV